MACKWIFLLLIGLGCSAISAEMETDYLKAAEKAKIEGKQLLLFFTGSDWSGPCMKIKNEVFNDEDFDENLGKNLIFVEIDLPLHKNLDFKIKEQNMNLIEKFDIQDFPTFILLDKNEKEVVKLQYVPESREEFAKELVHFMNADKQLREGMLAGVKDTKTLKDLYQIAVELQNNAAKELLLSEGIKEEDPFFLLEKFQMLVEKGRNAEASRLKEKLEAEHSCQIDFTLALVEFQNLACNASLSGNPEKIVKPLEGYLKVHAAEDVENVWRVEMMIAQAFLEADQWKQALDHAEVAYEFSPEGLKSEIQMLIDYLKEHQ